MSVSTAVDVVVVAYNSRDRLHACVRAVAGAEDIFVVVVDNASPTNDLEVVAELPILALALERNVGFAGGCNVGWRASTAPYVLFLNPDATITPDAVRVLARVLSSDPRVGAVGPKILNDDGDVDLSQRRFMRLSSTFAQALFLQRLFPRRPWSDPIVGDPAAYEVAGSPEWISGACLLVRRAALERLNGFDEGFFMYCEDMDLCRRLRDVGYDVRYEPAALARHEGGASAPRAAMHTTLTASRIRYAEKHQGRAAAIVNRIGIALGELTHMVVSRGGIRMRAGHARSLAVALTAPLRPAGASAVHAARR